MATELTAPDREQLSASALGRATFAPVWIVLVLVALVHALGLGVPVEVHYAVLLVMIVVLGLPHGGVDHLIVARALDRGLTARFVARFAAGYLALAACYGVVWFLAPAVGFLSFLALTWYHWGQGDLFPMVSVSAGRYPTGRLSRASTVLVRGGIPMVVPLLAFPWRYQSVAERVIGLFAVDGEGLAWLFRSDVRLATGVTFGVLTIAALAIGYRQTSSRRGWVIDAGETALLWTYFAVVPPVLAIGLYFAVWHSLRHVVRTLALDRVALAAMSRGATWRAVGRFVRDAAPATVGALVVLGTLAVAIPRSPSAVGSWSTADLGALFLVLLAVLTLPHAVVVTWLDRRQGLW